MENNDSVQADIECIYCRNKRPASNYTKAEHVLPQSFGKFKNNLTLIRLVCDTCNQFLGDSVELALARDTLEGQSRVDFGVKKAEDFKAPGRRSRIRIKIAEGEFKGTFAFRDYSETDGSVTLQPVPQVGFRYRESSEYEYFPLDELPDKSQLDGRNFNLHQPKSIRGLGVEAEELSKRLAEIGIPFRHAGDVVSSDESISLLCEVQGSIDYIVKRGTAKIAFNYLACWEGGDFVRQPAFDPIRKFVRYGELAPYPLVQINQKPILTDEVGQKRRVGHLVTIGYASDGGSIVAQVSLFNWLTYSVSLARGYGGERREITRGSFFNLANEEILGLGAISHMP